MSRITKPEKPLAEWTDEELRNRMAELRSALKEQENDELRNETRAISNECFRRAKAIGRDLGSSLRSVGRDWEVWTV